MYEFKDEERYKVSWQETSLSTPQFKYFGNSVDAEKFFHEMYSKCSYIEITEKKFQKGTPWSQNGIPWNFNLPIHPNT